jgi:hypothetical protein
MYHVRRLADEMVVQRALLDAAFLQRVHHRGDFGFEQDQVAHGHDVTAAELFECRPRSEGKSWFDRDAFERYRQIASREPYLVHIARQ